MATPPKTVARHSEGVHAAGRVARCCPIGSAADGTRRHANSVRLSSVIFAPAGLGLRHPAGSLEEDALHDFGVEDEAAPSARARKTSCFGFLTKPLGRNAEATGQVAEIDELVCFHRGPLGHSWVNRSMKSSWGHDAPRDSSIIARTPAFRRDAHPPQERLKNHPNRQNTGARRS